MSLNAVDNPVEYLNQTVWATIAPGSKGVGVKAIRYIAKGTPITDWSRDMRFAPFVFEMKEHDFKKLDPAIRKLILDRTIFSAAVYLMNFISPNAECYLQDFCNHSDTPNVSTDFIALRDIEVGEELFENYKDFKIQGNKMHALSKQHYDFL